MPYHEAMVIVGDTMAVAPKLAVFDRPFLMAMYDYDDIERARPGLVLNFCADNGTWTYRVDDMRNGLFYCTRTAGEDA